MTVIDPDIWTTAGNYLVVVANWVVWPFDRGFRPRGLSWLGTVVRHPQFGRSPWIRAPKLPFATGSMLASQIMERRADIIGDSTAIRLPFAQSSEPGRRPSRPISL